MKWTALLFVILTLSLLLAGARAALASSADKAGTSSNAQVQREQLGPNQQLLIADRVDANSEITYSTDKEMERTMTDQEKAEKENERRSWQMLQNMNIIQGGKKSQCPIQGPNQGSGQSPNQ
jgi:hypothetical protein